MTKTVEMEQITDELIVKASFIIGGYFTISGVKVSILETTRLDDNVLFEYILQDTSVDIAHLKNAMTLILPQMMECIIPVPGKGSIGVKVPNEWLNRLASIRLSAIQNEDLCTSQITDEERNFIPMDILERDVLINDAAKYILVAGVASTSSLQRRFSIGYNRASRIMDILEAIGVVGAGANGKPRDVLVSNEEELNTLLNGVRKHI